MLRRIISHKATRGSALTVIDQGICSLSNFLTGILVARAVSPTEFGTYSLFFAGIMILYGIQNAFVNWPLRVMGVQRKEADGSGYFKSQIRLQLALSGSVTLVSILMLGLFSSIDAYLVLAFGACLFFLQFQELLRVINLTRLTLASLLSMDLLTHGLRVGLLFVLFQHKLLSPTSALLIIAVTSALGSLVFRKDKVVRAVAHSSLLTAAAENFSFGKWIMLESIASNVSIQAYLYFTAAWVDTQSAGALNAAQNMLNFINVFLLGVISFAIPTARSKLIDFGYVVWRRWLLQVGVLLTGATTLFVATASIFAKPLLTIIYTPFFGEYDYLIPILAIYYCFAAANAVFSAAFNTAYLPQVGFAAKAASALITLGIAYPLLQAWGVAGAAVGLAATQVFWSIVYLIFIAKGTLRADKVEGRVKTCVLPRN